MLNSETQNQTMDTETLPPDPIIWVPYLSIVCLVAVLTGLVISFYTHMIRVKRRRDNARDYMEKSIDLKRKRRLYGMMREALDAPTKYDSLLPEAASNWKPDRNDTPLVACVPACSSSFCLDIASTHSRCAGNQCVHNNGLNISLSDSDYFHTLGRSIVGDHGGTKSGHSCGCLTTIPRRFHCCHHVDRRMCPNNIPACQCHGPIANNCCCCRHGVTPDRCKNYETKQCNVNHLGPPPGPESSSNQAKHCSRECSYRLLDRSNYNNKNDHNVSAQANSPCLFHTSRRDQTIPTNAQIVDESTPNERDSSPYLAPHSDSFKSVEESPGIARDDSFVSGHRASFEEKYRRTKSEFSKHREKHTDEYHHDGNNDTDNILRNNDKILHSPELHNNSESQSICSGGEQNQSTSFSEIYSSRTSFDEVSNHPPKGNPKVLSYQTEAEINFVSEYHSSNYRQSKKNQKPNNGGNALNTKKKIKFIPGQNLEGEINPTFCHDELSDADHSLTHNPIFHTKGGHDLGLQQGHTFLGNVENYDEMMVPKKRTKKKMSLLKHKREKSCENAFPPPIPLDVTLLAQRPLREDSGYASAVLSQDALRNLPSPFGAQTNEC